MKIAIGCSTYSYGASPIDIAELGETLGYESMSSEAHIDPPPPRPR